MCRCWLEDLRRLDVSGGLYLNVVIIHVAYLFVLFDDLTLGPLKASVFWKLDVEAE